MKYTYPLVVLSLIVSVVLQVVWLDQLFREQLKRTREDIENMLSATAKDNIYQSLYPDSTSNNAYKQFFLTPAWVQIRQGFDDAKGANMYRSFKMLNSKDSSVLDLSFVFFKNSKGFAKGPVFSTSMPFDEVKKYDSLSAIRMNKSVEAGLKRLDVYSPHYHLLPRYSVNGGPPPDSTQNIKADFISKKYSYDLEQLHKYQLVVPSVTMFIWYKMRYYLASSILMIILTGAAFYFILKLMRKQKLYVDARVAFTSNMTHEIKTPIATVALALESITKYNLIDEPDKLQSYLNISRQELQRLNLMVEKILNLNDEATGLALNNSPYDVQAGISEVISSLDLQIRAKSAICELKAFPEPCFVNGDAIHLTNIWYNLIENALKYAVAPLILTISVDCNSKWVTITFDDNGPGIDRLYHERIFDRFFRVPAKGDTHNIKGSGLGLNYVRQMIEKHGGSIQLISELGKGSTFIINLPSAL